MSYYAPQDSSASSVSPTNNYWPVGYIDTENSSTSLSSSMGCNFCGEMFYYEPPPDDIIFIPSPPLHPGYQSALSEIVEAGRQQQSADQCSFCNIFYDETEQLANLNNINRNFGGGYVVAFGSLIAIAAVVFLYMFGVRKPRIIPSFARTTIFKSHHTPSVNHHQMGKNNPLDDTLPHPPNMSDACYLQTNRDKNRTSPIISDHATHKKTAIPSKCWAQPGSIVNRTIRRVPNEYEIPSSRTNSTGASSAVYADTAYDHQQPNNNPRFFSPYNLHTYAEVREVMDPIEHFHTSSNSSAMLSESNYDNALYPHQGNMSMQNVPNGTVQMSDFNSMRPPQTIAYQAMQLNNQHQTLNHAHQMISKTQQPIYEQPQQRAQVIITSNNQGVNPVILNHRERIHNVI